MSNGIRLSAKQGLLLLFSATSVALFFGVSLWQGNLNQDEGWYLYASRMVFEGKMLYRDFHFSQGPLLPLVYGALYPVWSDAGVLGGRILTSFLALITIGIAAITAFRLSRDAKTGHLAGITTLWLAGFCVFGVNYLCIVKTYALTALFFSAGALAMTYVSGPRGSLAAMASGIFFACAAGTRLSMGLALPIIGLCLLAGRRQLKAPFAWFWFGIGAMLTLLAIFVPYLATSREQFLFAMTLHGKRVIGDWQSQLLFKAGFVARCAQSFLGPILVTIAAICLTRRRGKPLSITISPSLLLWLSIIGLSSLHFLTPFPYDDYQTPLLPVFAALASAALWNNISGRLQATAPANEQTSSRVMFGVVAGILVIAASSPILEKWAIIRQDRLWFITKQKSDLAVLRDVGAWIRARTGENDELLTWDPYLAVEANRRLPSGFEMAPFNFHPELSSEKAKSLCVLNELLLLDALTNSRAPVAAISGYAMAIRAPKMDLINPSDPFAGQVRQAIETQFNPTLQVENFGQGHTTLNLWTHKQSTASSPPPDH